MSVILKEQARRFIFVSEKITSNFETSSIERQSDSDPEFLKDFVIEFREAVSEACSGIMTALGQDEFQDKDHWISSGADQLIFSMFQSQTKSSQFGFLETVEAAVNCLLQLLKQLGHEARREMRHDIASITTDQELRFLSLLRDMQRYAVSGVAASTPDSNHHNRE